MHLETLQHTATHCNTLQHTYECEAVMMRDAKNSKYRPRKSRFDMNERY